MALAEHTRVNGHTRSALKARAHDVIEDFSALHKDVRKLARAANKAARVEVQHAGERLTSTAANLRQQARDRAAMLSDRVRERPGAALGISLGAGLLLGLLLSRR
ncbi:MAG: hypothetical protein NW206_15465 [Hyphomonadaceae bacterium]|nr:hypothetical protein [Hyphomonadaceae bacterium]